MNPERAKGGEGGGGEGAGDDVRGFRARIVAERPRMGPEDRFRFDCHPGLPCFNRCCGDVNIFLTPYDVLRMKRRLGMPSGEFLRRYTLLPVQEGMKTPVVLLRMGEDGRKSCPFVGEKGCGVYADRPWPCRMYPVGLASARGTEDGWRGERFYYLLDDGECRGCGESREWTVREWMSDQGVDEYDEWGEAWKELTLHRFFEKGGTLPPQKMEMLFTACYDLDRFREFVFRTTLLERFEVDDDLVEEMRTDDEALLRFGFLWLRYILFAEPTVRMRPGAAERYQEKQARKAGREPAPSGAGREAR